MKVNNYPLRTFILLKQFILTTVKQDKTLHQIYDNYFINPLHFL